jgi:hypothetical protein
MKKKTAIAISDDKIVNRIFSIRDKRVMIDSDLGELYGVSTKRLNEQVKRNAKRFPADFMFKLIREEKQYLIRTVPHLNKIKFSASLPYVFTEHGAVMLASVLNSKVAIRVNVQIVRIFTRMRELVLAQKDILLHLEKLEKKVSHHDRHIVIIFQHLRELLNPKTGAIRRIGFRRKQEE